MNKFILFFLICFFSIETSHSQKSTSYTIKANVNYLDANSISLKPGDTIFIEKGKRKYLQLKNVKGDSANPITIINQGEVIIHNTDFYYGFMLMNCSYFKLSGKGDSTIKYGIKVTSTGKGASGLSFAGLSSDFEVENIEISNAGFAGIMSKADPSCDSIHNRGFFTQKNIHIHDNYIHDVKGEGFYIGNSFFSGYNRNQKCPGIMLYPHEIQNVKINNNIIENTGWDGLQIGCATKNVFVFNNKIKNYGTENKKSQNNGIQIGEGTSGYFYDNKIQNGTGNGLIIFSPGNTIIYNNLIEASGRSGIFCDDRDSTENQTIAVLNNTFNGFSDNAIRWYNEKSHNVFKNNVFVDKGGNEKYLNFHPSDIKYEEQKNLFLKTYKTEKAESVNPESSFPLLNEGADVSEFLKGTEINIYNHVGAYFTSQN